VTYLDDAAAQSADGETLWMIDEAKSGNGDAFRDRDGLGIDALGECAGDDVEGVRNVTYRMKIRCGMVDDRRRILSLVPSVNTRTKGHNAAGGHSIECRQ
jgi:hypothetical protein